MNIKKPKDSVHSTSYKLGYTVSSILTAALIAGLVTLYLSYHLTCYSLFSINYCMWN